jgi:hypothetical protein
VILGFFLPWITFGAVLALHVALPARWIDGYVRDDRYRPLRYRTPGLAAGPRRRLRRRLDTRARGANIQRVEAGYATRFRRWTISPAPARTRGLGHPGALGRSRSSSEALHRSVAPRPTPPLSSSALNSRR